MRDESDRRPSARVRLEVASLDDSGSRPPEQTIGDERPRLSVLVVAAEADVRHYIGECLRARSDLRVYQASNARAAAELANTTPLDFVIAGRSDGLEALAHLRTIVLVDEVPYGTATVTPRVRLLSRPFSAEQLATEVDQLLREER